MRCFSKRGGSWKWKIYIDSTTRKFQKYRRRRFGSESKELRQSGDPSIVSLSLAEMRRLVEIETSALIALRAISTISSPGKDLSDAASALANALASPALHDG